MPLVTCGLSDEGVIAAEVQFSTDPLLTRFTEDLVEYDFSVEDVEKEFDTEIQVVSWDVEIIRVEECSIKE